MHVYLVKCKCNLLLFVIIKIMKWSNVQVIKALISIVHVWVIRWLPVVLTWHIAHILHTEHILHIKQTLFASV